ncbi:hypothetical protein AB0890_02440 [Streptomyces sp. NPDC005406]|uniref:hypothetical protein n=1 Tax=Streptomyces sp. NPDC005406 TaxID=3155339 RepID=UPI003455F8E5
MLAAAGMLLAAAPGQAQATERSGPGARTWVQETFPAGNANLKSAARVDAHTTWAVGSRRYGTGREGYNRPLILSREDGSARWGEQPAPEGFTGVLAGQASGSVHQNGFWSNFFGVSTTCDR